MDSARKPSWATSTPARPTNNANLPAFFHVKAQDGTAGYTGAEVDDTRPMTYEEDSALWTKLWGPDAPGIKMDRVSVFSVTSYRLADEMSRELLTLEGNTPQSSITDATACVGGNTVSFARVFATVNAIELDAIRCDMLYNNIEFCRRNSEGNLSRRLVGTVRIYTNNCLEIVPRLRQDIVFLDPPWGGKDYKAKSIVSLFVDSKPLHEVVLTCLAHAKYVCLKLPKNADLSHLQADPRMETCLSKSFPSFDLIVVRSLVTRNAKESDGQTDPRVETLLTSLIRSHHFHELLYKSAFVVKN